MKRQASLPVVRFGADMHVFVAVHGVQDMLSIGNERTQREESAVECY